MKHPNRFDGRRLRLDHLIEKFFGANALIAIVVLGLITIFLFREGSGFFAQNLQNLRLYRLAGLEYVDIMRDEVSRHTQLNRDLQALRMRQFLRLTREGATPQEAMAKLAEFDKFATAFEEAIVPVRGIVSDLSDVATTTKTEAETQALRVVQRQMLLDAGKREEADAVQVREIDFKAAVQPIMAMLPAFRTANSEFRLAVARLMDQPPKLPANGGEHEYHRIQNAVRDYLGGFSAVEKRLEQWDPFQPVPWYRSVTSFLFGSRWITASFWQDAYGVMPLLSGSLMVSFIALVIAVPLGVAAAIYVAEIATSTEQQLIKPYIEFISAIPSVVLGFFGIAVLGETIRALTQWDALSWISFFPIAERLNAFTAGCLLALMAVPTIFTLSEDALNSVPRAFKEASYALGASRLQTIFRVILPAAISGVISAVLLGFGRVIGETMVVLLCAGNRIAIPDFAHGLGVLFEPVHTMTGIVAQEMGEVERGVIHYRALFMVGLFLFFISLVINGAAQAAVRRFRAQHN